MWMKRLSRPALPRHSAILSPAQTSFSLAPTRATFSRTPPNVRCLRGISTFTMNKTDRMVKDEALRRIRTFHGPCGSSACGSSRSHKAASRGTPQTGSAKSKPTRPETKTKAEGCQAFRLGPRGSVGILVDRRFFFHLAGDFGPSQTLSKNLADCQIKAVTVIQRSSFRVLPIVIAERLFVNIAEQVKRFDRNIGSTDPTLQQTPE